MKIKMKDIPKSERPIERLFSCGVSSLSNEDLLAILIKTGSRDYSARDIATLVLSSVDGNLCDINFQKLSSINGMGSVKSAVILAALELGRRASSTISSINGVSLVSADIVFNYYRNIFVNKKQEFFYCVYLDSNKVVIKEKLLFIGTLDYSLVHPREVFKEAVSVSASSIICVHNHPSGNVLPSKNDFLITNKLIEVGDLLGIKVIDHVIIGRGKYYSFVENNDI